MHREQMLLRDSERDEQELESERRRARDRRQVDVASNSHTMAMCHYTVMPKISNCKNHVTGLNRLQCLLGCALENVIITETQSQNSEPFSIDIN